MKKIIVFCFCLICTVIVQGASINWSSSTKITDSSGTAVTTAAGFTSLMNGGSLVLVLLSDGTYTGTTSILSDDAAIKTQPVPQAGKVSGTFTFTYDSNVLKDGDILGVMFKDADGKLSQLVYTADKSLVSDTLVISGLESTGNIFSTNFNYATSGTFTVVPEPTSGLLLLFGLAGLALRRKQA